MSSPSDSTIVTNRVTKPFMFPNPSLIYQHHFRRVLFPNFSTSIHHAIKNMAKTRSTSTVAKKEGEVERPAKRAKLEITSSSTADAGEHDSLKPLIVLLMFIRIKFNQKYRKELVSNASHQSMESRRTCFDRERC